MAILVKANHYHEVRATAPSVDANVAGSQPTRDESLLPVQ
jgi:hypothetical protein